MDFSVFSILLTFFSNDILSFFELKNSLHVIVAVKKMLLMSDKNVS